MTGIDAPAKVNLTLHITGRRPDGYHLLDSLVVFAGICDRIDAAPDDRCSLTVSGPFSNGVPTDDSNLVLRAAKTLLRAHGRSEGVALHLTKSLPHAAGIGSGSSDAAATLRLVSGMLGLPLLPPDDDRVLALGADVPVCMMAPAPARMSGIGEVLEPAGRLPQAALVLVNPRVPVPTGAVFAALKSRTNPPMSALPETADFSDFVSWLTGQRNDLQDPAIAVAPAIGESLAALRAQSGVAWAGMSGSGATTVGVCRTIADARSASNAIRRACPDWWVAAAPMLAAD